MQPETKNCQNCKQDFVIEPEDFQFYEKMKVPAPTWCPECRLQRRLTWRNERTFYRRNCDLCAKSIFAVYPKDSEFTVYCRECWFSDKWDPLSFARDYDFSKNFFIQMRELQLQVPQIALQVTNSPDSEYINQAIDCKNCYMITSASNNEDCLHSTRLLNCKNIMECMAVNKVEKSFEAKECRESSNLVYSDDCYGSFDLIFCRDARNSNNCFMSANLRSKSNIWRGVPVSAGEFKDNLKSVNLGSYKNLQTLLNEYQDLSVKSMTHFSWQRNTLNCTGNVITNAKNCRNSFYVSEIENGNNLLFVDNGKDVYDVNNGCCVMERMYEVNTTGIKCANVRLSSDSWPEVQNATYVISCRNGVHDLFGCVGIQKKAYCILNKQYTKEEYEQLVPKIIQQMSDMPYVDSMGRTYAFGEFFPPELSPFAFNESAAFTYAPLSKEEVLAKGWRWKDEEEKTHKATISTDNIPDDIKDVKDEFTQEIISCEHDGKCNHQCTKAFRVVLAELNFYRSKSIALPRLCPNCRHHARVEKMTSFKLYKRNCSKCDKPIETAYAPNRPETVYCDECYSREVI